MGWHTALQIVIRMEFLAIVIRIDMALKQLLDYVDTMIKAKPTELNPSPFCLVMYP